jgi:tetratricopeptide (TPR) repeat protein
MRPWVGLASWALLFAGGIHPARAQGNTAQLELAAAACARGLALDPHYAPLHNTAGVIEYALGNVDRAVVEFRRAAELDPTLFAAQMNLGSMSLGLRAFDQARLAYERAIAIRPADYDAHLGRAAALEGAIEPASVASGTDLSALKGEIAMAKQIDPNRPDASYREGVVLEELAAWQPGQARRCFAEADASFRTFLVLARGKPGYEDAIARAGDRLNHVAGGLRFQVLPPPPAAAPPPPPVPIP